MGTLISDFLSYNYSVYDEISDLSKKEIDNFYSSILSGVKFNNSSPKLIMMLGISGAGKSTFFNNAKQYYKDYAFLSGDEIMHNLQIFKDLKLLNKSSHNDFRICETISRKLSFYILDYLISNKANIFYDCGGLDLNKKNMVRYISDLGYKIEINAILADKKIAIDRVIKRHYKNGGGYIPVDLIEQNFNEVLPAINYYKQFVDKINIYNNNNKIFLEETYIKR